MYKCLSIFTSMERVYSAYQVLDMVSDTLELELQVVLSHHVGSENWTGVLRKSIKYSQLLSCLFSSLMILFSHWPGWRVLILSEPGCSPGYTLYSFDENYHTLKRKASLRGVHSPSLACLLMVLSIWLWDSAASCQAGDIHSPWSWDSFAFQKPRPDRAQAVVRTRQGTIQKSCATRSHFDLPLMAMMGLDVILSSCFHLIWNGSYFSILLFICVHVCLEYERLPMFTSSSITVHIIVWNRVYRLTWSWPVSSRSLPVSTPVLWFQACAAVNSFIRRCWILEFRSSCLTNRHIIRAFSLAPLFLNGQCQAMVTPCMESMRRCVGRSHFSSVLFSFQKDLQIVAFPCLRIF